MKRIDLIVSIFVYMVFSSCSPDCQNITIKKPVWRFHYVNYTVDSLMNYVVTEDKVEFSKSQSPNSSDYLTHTISIRNTNKQYANEFSVKFHFDCIGYNTNDSLSEVQSALIEPNSTYTFAKRWDGGTPDNSNSNLFISKMEVIQNPKKIKLTRRVDELILKDTTVNNCRCNVDALKSEYKSIQDMYKKMKEEKLIKEN